MRNLLAWYPMHEGGLTAEDVSGNKAHGIYGGGVGAPAVNLVQGPVGAGRTFNTDDDGLVTGVPGLTEYTISAWFMVAGFGSGYRLGFNLNHPSDAFRRFGWGVGIGGFAGNSFEFTTSTFGWVPPEHKLFTWYHVCMVRRGNSLTGGYTLYVDAEEFDSRNSGNFQIGGTINWSIGAAWDGTAMFGQPWSMTNNQSAISNVRFYDKALDAEQMAEMTIDPYAPFAIKPTIMPFPATGLSAIRWGTVGRGRVRSGQDLGTHRIGGAP
jgi:hypothetical protein